MTILDRERIASLVPHRGAMCLIDGVETWNGTEIFCFTHSHNKSAHPMARGGRLPVLAGLEYGAQAMALHGALTGAVGAHPKMGVIASARALRWSTPWLDDLAERLDIRAKCLSATGAQVAYEFAIYAGARDILSGRIAAILQRELP